MFGLILDLLVAWFFDRQTQPHEHAVHRLTFTGGVTGSLIPASPSSREGLPLRTVQRVAGIFWRLARTEGLEPSTLGSEAQCPQDRYPCPRPQLTVLGDTRLTRKTSCACSWRVDLDDAADP